MGNLSGHVIRKEIMAGFECGALIPSSCQAFLRQIPALPHWPTTRIPMKGKVSVLAAFTLWSGPSRQRDMQLGGGRKGPVLSKLHSNHHACPPNLSSKLVLHACHLCLSSGGAPYLSSMNDCHQIFQIMIRCWLLLSMLPLLQSCNLFNDYCDTMEDQCGPVSRWYFHQYWWHCISCIIEESSSCLQSNEYPFRRRNV